MANFLKILRFLFQNQFRTSAKLIKVTYLPLFFIHSFIVSNSVKKNYRINRKKQVQLVSSETRDWLIYLDTAVKVMKDYLLLSLCHMKHLQNTCFIVSFRMFVIHFWNNVSSRISINVILFAWWNRGNTAYEMGNAIKSSIISRRSFRILYK